MLYSSKKIDLQAAEADSSNLGLKRGERERRAAKEESRQIGFLGKSESYAAQNSRPQDL